MMYHNLNPMTPIIGLLATLAVPAVAQNGYYFILGSGMPCSVQRVDPLLAPGKVAGHVHSVVGGNAFGPTMDFDTTQTSTCSTIRVKADKSNYWMPALYFHAKNGSFIRVPEKPEHRIYYKYGTGDNKPDLERSEFPPGFRMISGSANLRQDDGSMGVSGNQLNWVCHDGGSNPKATGFPKGFTNCNAYGLAASMRFPSCWNGEEFDAANPLAHMDFPTNQDGLAGCRAPFNVKRFPEIFVEYYLTTGTFDGEYGPNDTPWVLAQGDPTGYGFHMDFINGWETGVLAKAIKSCDIGNTGDPLDSPQCFGAGSLRSSSEADNCRVAPSVNEDVGLLDQTASDNSNTHGGVLAALPGCNPVQDGPEAATQKTGCGATTVLNGQPVIRAPQPLSSTSTEAPVKASSAKTSPTSSTSTNAPVKASSTKTAPSEPPSAGVALPAGWTSTGCFSDNVNHRVLGPRLEWWGVPITSSNCVKHCNSIGKTIAGTENGGQCFCGNHLINSVATPGKCNFPCVGNPKEKCGGSSTLSIFKKTGAHKVRRAHHHRRSGHGVVAAS